MKIKSITIELDPYQEDFNYEHASKLVFYDGKWTTDGPVQSRYTGLMHEIWKLARTYIKMEE